MVLRTSFAQNGEEFRSLVPQRGDLSPYLLQFFVHPSQLRLGPPLLVVAVIVGADHERLDLMAQESKPGVPMYRAHPVLKLTSIDGREDLILGETVFIPSVPSCR